MPSSPIAHRFYRLLRPILVRLGVVSLARWLIGGEMRRAVAVRLGLAGFQPEEIPAPQRGGGDVRAAHPELLEGIVLAADLQAESGLGELNRGYGRALLSANIPLQHHPLTYNLPRREPLSPELAAIPSAPRKPPKIMLMASPPAQIIETLRGLPPALRRAPYRLALWAWERDSFPAAWRALCAVAGINEVWTISHFARTVIAAAVDVPVVRIPIPVDARPTVGISRAALGLPERRFVVFFSFSAASTAARKNPFGVIEAFRRAFGRPAEGDPDSPLLVIRAHHLDQHDAKGLAAPLRQGVAGVGGKLLEGRLSHQAVVDRIALSDCYLSLHRAEGFGLGMAEAMGVGVPVIGTGYSGSMDFLTAETGFPIRYRLRPIHEDDHRYQPHLHTLYPPGDSQWAEPDLDHAAECLRFLYMNRSTARAQTERGQRLIETEYSPAAVGAFMAARLAHVGISTL